MGIRGFRLRALSCAVTAAVSAGLFFAAAASAAESNDILFAALAHGSASDVLTGSVADYWQEQTRSKSPILMQAKVIKMFKEQGCGRLSITLRQENVPLKKGGVAPFQFAYQMNLCPDGSPPQEGLDMATMPDTPSSFGPESIK